MKRTHLFLLVFLTLFFLGLVIYLIKFKGTIINSNKVGVIQTVHSPTPLQPDTTPEPTASPSATPKPLSFAEMNAQFGPCVHLPVLFYHHIQTKDSANALHQLPLTVFTPIFQNQMQYLKSKGYNIITPRDLIAFFDQGVKVPPKSIILTFDDGYQDFTTDAYPILQSLSFPATMFVPSGLVNNPNYLSWNEITSMSNVLFANHTWSHKNVGVSVSVMQQEISTADRELGEKNLNNPKVFAYPYGLTSPAAETYLQNLGYKLAFTTSPGNVQCKGKRLELPRIRIGNSSLAAYGF